MNQTTKMNLRVFDCPYRIGNVSQKLYGINSISEPVWSCINRCPYLDCEYNLHSENEPEWVNLYGRTSVW